jgi:hypothetical protein
MDSASSLICVGNRAAISLSGPSFTHSRGFQSDTARLRGTRIANPPIERYRIVPHRPTESHTRNLTRIRQRPEASLGNVSRVWLLAWVEEVRVVDARLPPNRDLRPPRFEPMPAEPPSLRQQESTRRTTGAHAAALATCNFSLQASAF